jgi:hypothetical protein
VRITGLIYRLVKTQHDSIPVNGKIFFVTLALAALFACDGSMQTASLTGEDFRFTPDLVRVLASASLTLSL